LHILVEGVPEGLSTKKINERMSCVEGVSEVHDLHVWNLCSGTVALSAHVVVDSNECAAVENPLPAIKKVLSEEFKIEHTTSR
jgi:cobalt-zinc-cadmium efflux system protein